MTGGQKEFCSSSPWALGDTAAEAPHWRPRGQRRCWSAGGGTGRGWSEATGVMISILSSRHSPSTPCGQPETSQNRTSSTLPFCHSDETNCDCYCWTFPGTILRLFIQEIFHIFSWSLIRDNVNLYTSLKSVRLYIKIGCGGDTVGGTQIHIYM